MQMADKSEPTAVRDLWRLQLVSSPLGILAFGILATVERRFFLFQRIR